MDNSYRQTEWFQFLDHGMQDLVRQSYELLDQELKHKRDRFHDYSYLLFPIAKAYEGFLKKYFHQIGLITEDSLYSRYFRIGKSLNPDLPERYRDETWFYDDLQEMCKHCNQRDLGPILWNAWVEGRNSVFHYYFPDHNRFIDLQAAKSRLEKFIDAMDQAVKCKHQYEQKD